MSTAISTAISLPRLRGEHGAEGHEWRERVGEVERIGIEATLGLAEQTVHLVRVRVRVGLGYGFGAQTVHLCRKKGGSANFLGQLARAIGSGSGLSGG